MSQDSEFFAELTWKQRSAVRRALCYILDKNKDVILDTHERNGLEDVHRWIAIFDEKNLPDTSGLKKERPAVEGTVYCVSTDGELFHGMYGSVEEALCEETKRPCWVGRAIPQRASAFCPPLVDCLMEAAIDECGSEATDGWPDASEDMEKDLHRELRDLVDRWADEHGLQPKFYMVQDQFKVTEDLKGNSATWQGKTSTSKE
jgi:hypothetical protein